MQNESSMGKAVAAIALLLVGVLVGVLGANMMGDSDTNTNQQQETAQSTQPSADTKAADVRVALNKALGEHVALASEAMRSGINGDEDFKAVATALKEDNTRELTKLVASVYGEEAGNQFSSLWKEHIGFFVDYVNATANNNEQGRQQAKKDLAGYAQEFATFLNGANSNIKKETVVAGATEHRDLVLATFDAYANGNFQKSYEKQQEAYDQVGDLADLLANNIVQQFPDKF